MSSNQEIVFFYINELNFKKFKESFEKFEIDLEDTDQEGNTMLNKAAMVGNYDITNYLICIGANVNTFNVSQI